MEMTSLWIVKQWVDHVVNILQKEIKFYGEIEKRFSVMKSKIRNLRRGIVERKKREKDRF